MFLETEKRPSGEPHRETRGKPEITKLSQAIREGAKLRPQGFHGVMGQLEAGTSCAMLAAYEAENGYPTGDFDSMDLRQWRLKRWGEDSVLVVGWNDGARLTREAIAEKLELQGL